MNADVGVYVFKLNACGCVQRGADDKRDVDNLCIIFVRETNEMHLVSTIVFR